MADSDPDDLAKRLEAASEGTADLDIEIGDMLGRLMKGDWALPYTRSVDAALTLIPPGWHLHRMERDAAESSQARGMNWWVILLRPSSPSVDFSRMTWWGATPSLAICSASLKAWAAMSAGLKND